MSIPEFFNMGGFGVYVWSAYGLTLTVLLGQVSWMSYKRRQIRRSLNRYLKRA